jgi:hypothetical protein
MAAQHFQPMLDRRQPVARTPHQHFAPVIDPFAQRFGEPDHLRDAALHQHVGVKRNTALKLGELEQRLHQQGGVDGAGAWLEHDPDVLGRLVAHVGEQRQLLLVEQLGDLLDQPALLHPPWDLRHHHRVGAAAGVLLLPARPQPKRPPPGLVGLGNGLGRIDDHPAGREIRSAHELEQATRLGVGVLDQVQRGVAQLGDVVRRNRGRHPDRDPLRAVGEQIRKRPGQHHRLVFGTVVGRAEIDGVLLDAFEQEARDLGQPRLRVAHRRRIIAVDIAEVALPVDQRIALREILRQPYQRVIHRLVTVRMELANHVTDNARAFLECGARVQSQLPHRIDQPAMHGLKPVARIGKRTVHDGGEGVGEIALLERLAQRNLLDVAGVRRNQLLSHGASVLRRQPMNKGHGTVPTRARSRRAKRPAFFAAALPPATASSARMPRPAPVSNPRGPPVVCPDRIAAGTVSSGVRNCVRRTKSAPSAAA